MFIRKLAVILCLTSTLNIFAASSSTRTGLRDLDSTHIDSSSEEQLKIIAFSYLQNYFDLADAEKKRFEHASIASGKFGSVVIPESPVAGDYVVKFSRDDQEYSDFYTLFGLPEIKNIDGFSVCLPLGIGEVYGDFVNVQILPYVVNQGDNLIAQAMQQVVRKLDSEVERKRIQRLGIAMGVFQSASFKKETETSLSHGDFHPWNVLDDDIQLTLIDVGSMKIASIHTDLFYLAFKTVQSINATVPFENNKDGYQDMFRLFYAEYIKELSAEMREVLRKDYKKDLAFLLAKAGTEMIFDRQINGELHCFTSELIEMLNSIVQDELVKM